MEDLRFYTKLKSPDNHLVLFRKGLTRESPTFEITECAIDWKLEMYASSEGVSNIYAQIYGIKIKGIATAYYLDVAEKVRSFSIALDTFSWKIESKIKRLGKSFSIVPYGIQIDADKKEIIIEF